MDRWYTEGLERKVGYPAWMGKTEPLNGGAGDWRPPMPREGDALRELGLDEGYFHPPVWGRIPMPVESVILEEDEHYRMREVAFSCSMKAVLSLDPPWLLVRSAGHVRAELLSRVHVTCSWFGNHKSAIGPSFFSTSTVYWSAAPPLPEDVNREISMILSAAEKENL
jgi:hypothetical protein